MKPSERRALEAQKKADKERALEAEKAENEAAPSSDTTRNGSPSEHGAPKKKEGFFKSHSRLIAFLATSFLIITVFSPFAVDMFLDYRSKNDVITDKKDITLEQVYFVADNYGEMTWKSFDNFNYTDRSRDDGKYYKHEYPIKDTGFVLVVGGQTRTGAPEYIYIQSYKDAAYADLAKDDVKKFVNKYSEKEN